MTTRTPVLYREDGTETELPFRFEICSHCDGHGKSSAYLGAFTARDLAELDDDFLEDYRRGRLDRPCEHCGGSGKIRVADLKCMSKADRRAYRQQCADERADRETERQERLLEGGWREEGWFE